MLHSGHRKRMRARLSSDGLDSFTDEQVLEYILTLAIPRRDVRPIAAALLEIYGTLARVLEASPEELIKVEGIGSHTAALLTLTPLLQRRYALSRNPDHPILATTEEICAYLQPYFSGCNEECVYLLCMDAKCKVLDCRKVSTGGMNSVGFNLRRVVEIVLQQRATTAVLAHNHPWGLALPSREDEFVTKELQNALKVVNVHLADHIIVCEEDCVSMAASGLLQRY